MMYRLCLPLLLLTTLVITEAETTETEIRSPRTFLPNGSPSRPTATGTCRPITWVQHISEGQINEPTQDDTHSTESGQTENICISRRNTGRIRS